MKAVFCTFNVSIKDKIISTIDDLKIKSYQVIDEVSAVPEKGSPRLNTAVWPGYNSMVIIQFENDNEADNLLNILKNINSSAEYDEELITAYTVRIEDYFCE